MQLEPVLGDVDPPELCPSPAACAARAWGSGPGLRRKRLPGLSSFVATGAPHSEAGSTTLAMLGLPFAARGAAGNKERRAAPRLARHGPPLPRRPVAERWPTPTPAASRRLRAPRGGDGRRRGWGWAGSEGRDARHGGVAARNHRCRSGAVRSKGARPARRPQRNAAPARPAPTQAPSEAGRRAARRRDRPPFTVPQGNRQRRSARRKRRSAGRSVRPSAPGIGRRAGACPAPL